MTEKWRLTLLIGPHGFCSQGNLTEDVIEKCRRESSTFNEICKGLKEREFNSWWKS